MAAGFVSLALIEVGGLAAPDLFGLGSDVATASGDLSAQIKLSGSATDQASAQGAIVADGFTSLVLLASGGLGSGGGTSSIAGAAHDVASASGSLTTGSLLSGAAHDVATASGALGLDGFFSLTLIGVGLGEPIPANLLVGSAFVASTATGDLTKGGFRSPTLLGNIEPWSLRARFMAQFVSPPLVGSASDTVTAGGGLTTRVDIAGAATDTATATGSLSTGAFLDAIARARASAHGDLSGGSPYVVTSVYVVTAPARALRVPAAERKYTARK